MMGGRILSPGELQNSSQLKLLPPSLFKNSILPPFFHLHRGALSAFFTFNSDSESSVSSRPPQNVIPVVDLSDEGSPEGNNDSSPATANVNVDPELGLGSKVPKTYRNFSSKVTRFSSRYTNHVSTLFPNSDLG
ncbi:Respiration factor 2 [Sesbania bispinosa]|nr:Respiration factor 2 [Sesbania bispinosa]